jgi:hypothetical protein
MLHDPSHYEPPPIAHEIEVSEDDKAILRALAADLAEVAADPVNEERAVLWQQLNDLESARPMIWINEIPWHEMDVNGELTLQTQDPWAQDQERDLRRTLYQWRHLQGDMIVNDFLTCPLAIHSTDFGIIEDVEVARTDDANDIVSREFHIQIKDWDDLEKIKMPVVTHNEAATEFRYQAMCEVYDGIMPVRKMGQTHVWYTPWDYLVRWWGVQEAMMDLVMRPDLVHAGVERTVQAWMVEMDQFESRNLLALDNNNTRIGSGGYGYTRELPGDDYDPAWVKTHNMWGCSNAQIFSEVSPQMRWEFAVEHDLKWLSRFGLTYYGCCEPLDQSIDVIKRIPNLRKISTTPWADVDSMVEQVGTDYVLSRKPNPNVFARDEFNPQLARDQLVEFLGASKGCHRELIMKDISTVRYDPHRLWQWADIAAEVVQDYAT